MFFSQTFDVLFYRHDATKRTAFRRKFRTSLSIDQFRSALSAFSSISYVEHGPVKNAGDALQCSRRALDYYTFSDPPEAFLQDLCSSVSILVEEGINTTMFIVLSRNISFLFFYLNPIAQIGMTGSKDC